MALSLCLRLIKNFLGNHHMRNKILTTNILSFVIFVCIALSPQQGIAQQPDIKQSMVKIYTTQIEPDYHNPWRLGDAEQISGSGFVIENNLILTNAHVVSNQTYIQVRLFGDPKKHLAYVVGISHEADLALLSLKDNTETPKSSSAKPMNSLKSCLGLISAAS